MYGTWAFVRFSYLRLAARTRSLIDGSATLGQMAAKRRIPVIRWKDSVNRTELVDRIQAAKPDLLVGCLGEKPRDNLLKTAPHGLLFFHCSRLPRFAGREPVFWTLLEDPTAAGVTFLKAQKHGDSNRTAMQVGTDLTGVTSLHEAATTLSELAGANIVESIHRLVRGDLHANGLGEQAQTRHWPTPYYRKEFLRKGLRFV